MRKDSIKMILAGLLALATSASAVAEPPVYVKLASIDAGRLVDTRSDEALRTKAAFDRARARCIAPNGLENQVSVIRGQLLDKRRAASNVEILEGLAGILYGASKKPECASILAMYASMRLGDNPDMNTHTDVVLGIRGLAKAGILGFSVDGTPR
ncbi:MAG: hypothetical protein ACOY95_06755 [Pseudomonadota bacterium]